MTSGIGARGRFGKRDFVYLSDEDAYRCPAGEKLKYYYTNGQKLRRYWTNACRHCALKQRCTTGVQRRIARWEHEDVANFGSFDSLNVLIRCGASWWASRMRCTGQARVSMRRAGEPLRWRCPQTD